MKKSQSFTQPQPQNVIENPFLALSGNDGTELTHAFKKLNKNLDQ